MINIRRVLSLDGGGIKGVFTASFLASIEDQLDAPIGQYFDLIVGTSTGGIIALGLGLGFRASEMLTFYENLGTTVFRGNGRLRALRQLGFSKYSQGPLRVAIQSTFGARKLGHSMSRLVIPSLNLETGQVHLFKTAHHPRFQNDHRQNVVDVALATSAAPTFFPTHRNASGLPLIDGGMWANNPIAVAAIEAVTILDWCPERLRILSVGCTGTPLGVGLGRHVGMGLSYWALRAADVFMAGQTSGALGMALHLAGKDNVLRINPTVERGRFALDSLREIPSLKGLGASEARNALPTLNDVFFQTISEEFVPFHSLC